MGLKQTKYAFRAKGQSSHKEDRIWMSPDFGVAKSYAMFMKEPYIMIYDISDLKLIIDDGEEYKKYDAYFSDINKDMQYERNDKRRLKDPNFKKEEEKVHTNIEDAKEKGYDGILYQANYKTAKRKHNDTEIHIWQNTPQPIHTFEYPQDGKWTSHKAEMLLQCGAKKGDVKIQESRIPTLDEFINEMREYESK